MMKRILIIGLQGSGKSTFANKLGQSLDRKVIHLDKLYYRSGWQAVSKPEWQEILKEVTLQKEWIIDGNYHSSLDARIELADTIVFLNFPKWLCLFRAYKRSFKKDQPFDKAKGNNEKVSFDLIKKILRYPKNEVLNKLEKHKNTKKIFILKNSNEAEALLIELEKNSSLL